MSYKDVGFNDYPPELIQVMLRAANGEVIRIPVPDEATGTRLRQEFYTMRRKAKKEAPEIASLMEKVTIKLLDEGDYGNGNRRCLQFEQHFAKLAELIRDAGVLETGETLPDPVYQGMDKAAPAEAELPPGPIAYPGAKDSFADRLTQWQNEESGDK